MDFNNYCGGRGGGGDMCSEWGRAEAGEGAGYNNYTHVRRKQPPSHVLYVIDNVAFREVIQPSKQSTLSHGMVLKIHSYEPEYTDKLKIGKECYQRVSVRGTDT